jgi:hypothetical protein
MSGKIRQIRSRAVAVPYFAETVTVRGNCTYETHEKHGKHFNVKAYRTMSVL